MHLLKATPGTVTDGSEAVDLGQDPGEIVVLSAADTELANLAQARAELGDGYPELRLANLMQLGHNMSVDLYLEQTAAAAKLIVVRLLGGMGYWPYGVEQLQRLAEEQGTAIALLPGDDQPDAELARRSTVSEAAYHRLWQYCVHGGPANARGFLGYAAELAGHPGFGWSEPAPLLRAGLYWPGHETPTLDDLREARDTAAGVTVESDVREYVTRLAQFTRRHADLGVSPRGSLAVLQAAQGRAVLDGREYVIPDDIQTEARVVFPHRVRTNTAETTPESVVESALESVRVE